MYKCKVCNKEFELQKKDRYIARDVGKSGLAALAGGSEETLYDAFDCPHCGCQNVIQERKRRYVNIKVVDVEEPIENEEEECIVASEFDDEEDCWDA